MADGELEMNLSTILVPTDFSADARRALDTAVDLARTLGGRIVLLHAFSVDVPLAGAPYGGGVILPEGFYVEYRNQAKMQVERLAKEVAAKENVEIRGVAIQDVAWSAILEQAESLPADLVVIGTRGLTGIKHVALGSTAERVVRKAKCPVLTVKVSESKTT
jgi:nucleotide-binding universal stress UspA family protein